MKKGSWWKAIGLVVLSLTSSLVIGLSNHHATSAVAQNISQTKQSSKKILVVSYAVTKAAYERIFPKFAAEWKKKTGENVVFEMTNGGSGAQTRAVIGGLEADIVALALARDTLKIQEAGLIKPGWEDELPNESIVTTSVATLVMRKPGVVKKWSDLASGKVKIITANPKTSGIAQWNFLALWGSITRTGGTEQQARAFVEKVYQNVPVLPKDARESTELFYTQEQGDVLINYENEVLLANDKREKYPYVTPLDVNISIDNPVAAVDTYVDKHGNRKVVEAFLKYLFTPQAQREFAQVGFRPVNGQVRREFARKYSKVNRLFTIKDLGGWTAVGDKFFKDGAIFDQILRKK